LGYGYYNDYYDYGYGYDDPYYYGDGGCYIVRRSVLTPYGWRIRSVQVCG
jgi:1,4-dihydroxy-2-naphthoate octaprenyltransferase